MRLRKLILGLAAVGVVGVGAVGAANADRIMRGLQSGRSLPELLVYAADVLKVRYPSVGEPLAPLADSLRPSPGAVSAFPDGVTLADWRGTGASPDLHLPAPFYGGGLPEPTPVAVATAGMARRTAPDTVVVDTAEALRRALREAVPGREILIAPGTYELRGRGIDLDAGGRADAPIVVRAESLGAVTLNLDMMEGFHVRAPFWVFENLDIRGTCDNSGRCEHAFHVVGKARGTIIRNTRMVDFNSPLKVNGLRGAYPDAGLVEFSTFAATDRRRTDSPVSFVDIVGASDWTVRHSLIADMAKGGGDRISYAGFMKGGGARGVFDANLVICSMAVPVKGETRVGLSFGGGGSAGGDCRGGACDGVEHAEGRMTNNIVMHCPDVGIYLNKATGTEVAHNTLYNTLGIDVRYPQSTARLRNNVIAGRVHEREGGTAIEGDNIVLGSFFSADRRPAEMRGWYADPDAADFRLRDVPPLLAAGLKLETVDTDFCGRRRGAGGADLGAIEYRAGGCSPADFLSSLAPYPEEAKRP
ncbi:hypothetical protein [Caenispirillum salinarum]|uniref:hypothetical protein n=1 Tax=Caenispirillum salinarum TaxID=859058 RepID=UPI00384F044C